ncbi:MAG: hypothetical protein Q4F25_01765 [Eubacteriales bacterium]|nr:hypothetical protein [Eubacteriales bacterium]
MKYGFKKRLSVLSVVLILIMVLGAPMAAYAERAIDWSYEVKPIKQNTWAPESNHFEDDSTTIFSTKVGSPGVMTFKLSNEYAHAMLYTVLSDAKRTTFDKGRCTEICKSKDGLLTSQGTLTCAVEKGTYYLVVYGGKVKYSFSAMKAQKNTTRAKAQKLKAGKLGKINFTWKKHPSRWYKVSNPKKKKIKVFLNRDMNISIYNSKKKRLSTTRNSEGTKYTTTEVQPKGTYYIRVRSGWKGSSDGIGKYVTIKWK